MSTSEHSSTSPSSFDAQPRNQLICVFAGAFCSVAEKAIEPLVGVLGPQHGVMETVGVGTGVMVAVADPDFVGSAADVAVMVTSADWPPPGIDIGAV